MSKSLEELQGVVLWVPLELWQPEGEQWTRRYCQAPRHDQRFRPTSYVFVGVEPVDPEDGILEPALIIVGMCEECIGIIARDLGLDVERDAVRDFDWDALE